MSLLKVENLSVTFLNNNTQIKVLQEVNFEILQGQTLSLIGESGSGKTITAYSILQLLPRNAFYAKDSKIIFDNQDLLSMTEKNIRKIRGSEIAMIFQEPATALNPVRTIGDQIGESLRLHRKLRGKVLHLEILKYLKDVALPNPEEIINAYPHTLSGGMKQRVMIAMALCCQPKLLILDEPTTALDVSTQASILALLKDLQKRFNLSLLFITHDLAIAAKMSDTVAVMQLGKVVEYGLVESILKNPQHPYTRKLISALPKEAKPGIPQDAKTLLRVENVKIYFPIKRGLFQRTVRVVPAVDGVSFTLKSGETLGLVGESGCGKTSLARGIMSLINTTGGCIFFEGQELSILDAPSLRMMRKHFQMIFQDPYGAMDPRCRVLDVISEGMVALNTEPNRQKRIEKVDSLLEAVGLLKEHRDRFPHEFSGGQRQRICIARALALEPKLIICDEPTSSLDVTVQAQIIDLLIRLQLERRLSYVLITHNMAVVRAMAHKIAVMYQGKIVEAGICEEVLANPKHAYTKMLLAAETI